MSRPTPTPWTSAAAAQPKRQQKKRGGGGGGSGSSKHHQQHSSPQVHALQTLISNLENPPPPTSAPVPSQGSQGCFCQARTHPLSPHTPQCVACGLALCARNPPFEPCPFAACRQPLLTPHATRALLDRLRAQVARVVADEEDARRRLDEQRAREAGAFPELGGPAGTTTTTTTTTTTSSSSTGIGIGGSTGAAAAKTGSYTTQGPQQQFHKVLSLSGKGKLTATYARTSPSPSSSSLHAKAKEAKEDDEKLPPPPEGPECVKLTSARSNAKKRAFENLRGEGPVYVPLAGASDARKGPARKRRPQNKENQPQ